MNHVGRLWRLVGLQQSYVSKVESGTSASKNPLAVVNEPRFRHPAGITKTNDRVPLLFEETLT